ncbi:ABC transporter, ATP-binding protein (cluster 1, maltose/g3p/polyamine/iron); ABC transporter, ATP-binding protein (cluster 10, nitrate/sulfonate/bicarbonate) [hydrothermal vent metagenome]|uniref:ABC transporter, ATP-binding protein (Cluster 1, maltose/g3p/polyamine/iron) ABC transporter, ATP-binding protein (Cluster 10, nitrate/sulfonate/bicarbonate) n=1 Tax=hydrothermal vent metagenome TaxID=652676 RepID=A0A3B0T9G5_9ZZZZ
MPTIEATNITKTYGSFTAVKNVDLHVAQGEVVCLLGPSGCGKTTTLRVIAGLEAATAGDVRVAGRMMNSLAPQKRNIAMVFQFYALYPSVTIGENIAFPLYYERLPAAERRKRVAKVAQILELEGVLDRLPGQVSEGEKQRVAVARAIIRDPNCFLFDEPLSRLDVELRQSMRGQIKEVLAGLSKATVIVTHDQIEALTMAHRIAIMRDGEIEQIGTPHQVFSKPDNVFVAGFIGSPKMNLLEGDVAEVSDGEIVVNIGSQTMAIPIGVPDVSPGRSRLTIGIRPRALTPTDEASAASLSAAVELIEPMGAETLIHLKDGTDTEYRVVVKRSQKVAPGETIHFTCKAEQMHVFNEHGQAVRS